MIVYIAGPFSGDVEANVKRAIAAGNEVLELGHTPIIPHLFVHVDSMHSRPYERWMEACLEMVQGAADAVYRIPGVSPGADREVEVARYFDLPVLRSSEELKHFLGAWK